MEERKKFTDYRYDVWGDSFNWWAKRNWETIKYICFHHSVTISTNNHKQDVDYIAEIHKRNGWGGIGYHFVITADGMVWYVGDISTSRANVADKNHLVIGICMVGDFTKHNPTDDQILSAHDLAKYLITNVPALTSLNGWDSVKGHKELQATACPGTYWKGVADSIYERIKNRIPYTPQTEPEPVIDWEKRYYELREEKEKEIDNYKLLMEALKTEKVDLSKQLADNQNECQSKIAELNQKIENLEKEIYPPLEDYPSNVIFKRAFEIIINYFKRK